MTEEPRSWQRPSAFYSHRVKYIIYVIIVAYFLITLFFMRISFDRFVIGLHAGSDLLSQMYPPTSRRFDEVIADTITTLQMAVLATIFGMILTIPMAVMAAENLVPRPVYIVSRSILGLARALHELVLAIIFVALFGFGPFAGIVALVVKSVGFVGKLLAEDIEDISTGPVEAITATGASRTKIWIYAVAPQVIPRFIGLTIYRWDINIRQSTIVGVVGAGGIGTLLIQAIGYYDYALLSTIILVIIGLVLIGEYVSLIMRRRLA